MTYNDRFAAAQSAWDNASPPEYDAPPSLENYSDALDKLVADTDRLTTFCMDEQPDYTTFIQLYHAHGLPKRDGSKRDDELILKYTESLDGLLVHYRDWLDDTLEDAARKELELEHERMRDDAAENAAEMRAMGY
jgi:hypothetical protein